MDTTIETLIQEITQAFNGVRLEDGIGVYEADCIDMCVEPNSAQYLRWKNKDEREDWTKLLPYFLGEETAERFYPSSCWFFMDDKGKRFVLPCFLIMELKTNNSIFSSFAGDGAYLNILSKQQLAIFAKTLKWLMARAFEADDDFEFDDYCSCLEKVNKYLALGA